MQPRWGMVPQFSSWKRSGLKKGLGGNCTLCVWHSRMWTRPTSDREVDSGWAQIMCIECRLKATRETFSYGQSTLFKSVSFLFLHEGKVPEILLTLVTIYTQCVLHARHVCKKHVQHFSCLDVRSFSLRTFSTRRLTERLSILKWQVLPCAQPNYQCFHWNILWYLPHPAGSVGQPYFPRLSITPGVLISLYLRYPCYHIYHVRFPSFY